MVAAPNELPHAPPIEDRWFTELNDKSVHANGRTYRLRVEGVHQSAAEVWIQLAPMQNCEYGVLVHCWQRQSAAEVLDRLGKELAANTQIQFVDAAGPFVRLLLTQSKSS